MEPVTRSSVQAGNSEVRSTTALAVNEPINPITPRQPFSLSLSALGSSPFNDASARRSTTPSTSIVANMAPSANKVPQEAAILAVVRGQLATLEDKLSSQILRVQQQGDRLRETAMSRVDTKLASLEDQLPRSERRLAELNGNVKGLSDEMQSQIRRVDQIDLRLWEWRRDLEEEIRKRLTEVETATQQIASSQRVSKAAIEDALKRFGQRLQRVETMMEERLNHHEETNNGLLTLHSRLSDLEDSSSLHVANSEAIIEATAARVTALQAQDAGSITPQLQVQLSEFDHRFDGVMNRLASVQKDCTALRENAEATEERCRALRNLSDNRDEQLRNFMDRLERENWDSRFKALQSKIQDIEQVKLSTLEQVQILNHKFEIQQQDHGAAIKSPLKSPKESEAGGSCASTADSSPFAEVPRIRIIKHDSRQVTEPLTQAAGALLPLNEVSDRFGQLEGAVATITEQMQELQALAEDQALGPQITALVSQLKEVAPKVIRQEITIMSLGEKVSKQQHDLASLTDQVHDVEVRLSLDISKAMEDSKHIEARTIALEFQELESIQARTSRLEVELARVVSEIEGPGGLNETIEEVLQNEVAQQEAFVIAPRTSLQLELLEASSALGQEEIDVDQVPTQSSRLTKRRASATE